MQTTIREIIESLNNEIKRLNNIVENKDNGLSLDDEVGYTGELHGHLYYTNKNNGEKRRI